MRLERLTSDQWKWLSQSAHQAVFAELRDSGMDRVHHVLLALEGDIPVGYITIQEREANTAHLQYGGVFPPSKGSPKAVRAWALAINRLRETYKRATMFVANDNGPMLKLGLSMGFKVVGIRSQAGKILLEHMLEFTERE